MTYEEFQKNACKAAKILLDAIIESNKNIWNKGKEQSIKDPDAWRAELDEG